MLIARNPSQLTTTQPAANNKAETNGADIFYPQLFGKPIEYYFYPNSSVPVFCPTLEQFSDFEALVAAIEPLALRAGVCKIVPPKKWREELEQGGKSVRVFADDEFPIMKPIVQHFNGSSGIFHQYNVEFHRKLRLAQFFQISQDASHKVPEYNKAKSAEAGASKDGKKDASKEQDALAMDNKSKRSGSERAKKGRKEVPQVFESDTVGIAVDYGTGRVQLTSAAVDALQATIRSDAMRAKFQPAVATYKPHPDTNGEPAADTNCAQPPRQFTADDGRALFVTEKEYAENEELERIYWKNMLFQPPMYGADVLGTLFPEYEKFPHWNIRNLPGLLRRIGQRMPGVNDPYLYLGMWKATFAWHVEDMDLYSINYIHFGAPKSWYTIPIEAHSRFEMSMQNVFANDYKNCSQFLRHKAFLLSPRFLASQGIPFNRVVQRAGEIILTFPLGYHAGYNHGFNCAESVNFALDRWLDVAWESKHCECVKDSVTIDLMEWFGDKKKAKGSSQAGGKTIEHGSSGHEATNDDDDMCLRDRMLRESPRRHAAAAAAIASASSSKSRRYTPNDQLLLSDVAEHKAVSVPKRPGRPRKTDSGRHCGMSVIAAAASESVAAGSKRKQSVSSAVKAEPAAKRSPRKPKRASLLVEAGADPDAELKGIITDELADIDLSRRFGSLHTPVGVCGGCLLPISMTDNKDGDMTMKGDVDTTSAVTVIECQQCGLTVHPQCSALAFDDGHYRCANCVMDTDQLSCALCAYQNGLLLPISNEKDVGGESDTVIENADNEHAQQKTEFAHFLCANFTNETYFDFPGSTTDSQSSSNKLPAGGDNESNSVSTRSRTVAKAATAAKLAMVSRVVSWRSVAKKASPSLELMENSAKVCGFSAIARTKYATKCVFCHGSNDSSSRHFKQCFGPVVQCAQSKCFRTFHPMCAAVHNLGLLDWSQCKAYCLQHRPQ
ncbi:JmjC domain, hydroxylase-domain-containing protein [Coemansia spiralis]|nr:JmjC domain, hydroxylase-domain-containing protein [Coemansia spiralis]